MSDAGRATSGASTLCHEHLGEGRCVAAENGSREAPRPTHGLNRRGFLGAAGAGAAGVVAGSGALALPRTAEAAVADPDSPLERLGEAFKIRWEAAHYEFNQPLPRHRPNGDDERYPNKIASYSKALPHNAIGEPDVAAYGALVAALDSGRPEAFDRVPLAPGAVRKLVHPQGALEFEVFGPDSHQVTIPPAPRFDSAQHAGEMVELYWQALARDIPFAEWPTDPTIAAAAEELSRLSDFRGPKTAGRVTPQTLFRFDLPGALTGPYVSQLALLDIPYGTFVIKQQGRTLVPGAEYLATVPDWLSAQNGGPIPAQRLDDQLRYVRSGRDLAQHVHIDFVYANYWNALLLLIAMRAPVDQNNPYRTSANQVGNSVLGNPHVASLLGAVSTRALKAVWFQKWGVHRRLRPEMMGGRIHHHLVGAAEYPIHPDVLGSGAVVRTRARQGNALLTQAYAEGAPVHPSYGGGHAVLAGACITVLKAFFDESFVIPSPVVASRDGLALEPWSGEALTVGGELNKLASNVAAGRDWAGIHYRSDQIEALRLGEEVALRLMREDELTYNERPVFRGFSLTKLDGTTITI